MVEGDTRVEARPLLLALVWVERPLEVGCGRWRVHLRLHHAERRGRIERRSRDPDSSVGGRMERRSRDPNVIDARLFLRCRARYRHARLARPCLLGLGWLLRRDLADLGTVLVRVRQRAVLLGQGDKGFQALRSRWPNALLHVEDSSKSACRSFITGSRPSVVPPSLTAKSESIRGRFHAEPSALAIDLSSSGPAPKIATCRRWRSASTNGKRVSAFSVRVSLPTIIAMFGCYLGAGKKVSNTPTGVPNFVLLCGGKGTRQPFGAPIL